MHDVAVQTDGVEDEEPKPKPQDEDPKSKPQDEEPKPKPWGKWHYVGLAAVGAVVAPLAAPLALGAVGFTSAGIAGGSLAASWMSAAAVANGGGVAAGSVVAVLQSVGAAGLGLAGTAATATAGAAAVGGIGAGVGTAANALKKEKQTTSGPDDGGNEDENEGDPKDNAPRRDDGSCGTKGKTSEAKRNNPRDNFEVQGMTYRRGSHVVSDVSTQTEK